MIPSHFPPLFLSPLHNPTSTSSSSTPTSSRKVSLFSTSIHTESAFSDGRIHLYQCCSHSLGQSSVPNSSGKYCISIHFPNSRDMSRSLRSISLRLSTSKNHHHGSRAVRASMSLTSVFVGRTRSWRGRLFCLHRHGRTYLLSR